MSVKAKVLMVDDEPNILSGYRRSIGRSYELTTANSGREAIKIMANDGPFAVVVTDMRMPEMDGLEFLQHAKAKHPKTVYAMLTGNADQQTAINAINQGQIFRFLNKPCDAEVLDHTIRACKAQYDLIHAEAELLSNTLSGSVKLLIEAMMISDPIAADAVRCVNEGVKITINALGIPSDWRFSLASSLFMIGSITTPRTSDSEIFTDEYMSLCARSGAKLLRHISRLDLVAQIILHQRMRQDLPEKTTASDDESRVVIGSQLLRFSFDWYCASKEYEGDRRLGLQKLSSSPSEYDTRLIAAAQSVYKESTHALHPVSQHVIVDIEIRELHPGLLVENDIYTNDDSLLIAKGQVLSQLMIDRLRGFCKAGLIPQSVRVRVDKSDDKTYRESA